MRRRTLLIAPGAVLSAAAQPSDRGIHVLTTAAGTGEWRSMLDRVLALDYISGLLVYVNWSKFEPRQGEFDWQYFEAPLEAAQRHGKRAGFGLMVQGMSPDWVKRTCGTFTFEHIHPAVGTVVSPIPWDAGYQSALAAAATAMGRKLDGHPRLLYMSINGPASLFGVETNFPVKKMAPAEAEKLGYTHEKFAAGWKRGVDLFTAAFPKSRLALGLHSDISLGPQDRDVRMAVVREIRDYAIERQRGAGKRLIVRLLGLGPNNPRYFGAPYRANGPMSDYVTLAWEVRGRASLAYEAARVYSRPNANGMKPLSPAEFESVLQNGVSHGPEWLEIKEPDVWNTPAGTIYEPYAGLLGEAARRLRG